MEQKKTKEYMTMWEVSKALSFINMMLNASKQTYEGTKTMVKGNNKFLLEETNNALKLIEVLGYVLNVRTLEEFANDVTKKIIKD